MRPAHYPGPAARYAQRGAALIMVLVFLLLLTMLGLAASNTATLEERMAGNIKDQNLAFQSAETALAFAEEWVRSRASAAEVAVDTTKGIYAPATSGQDEVWESVDWSGGSALAAVVFYPNTPGATASTTLDLGDVSTMPRYIIENLGTKPASPGPGTVLTVRITALGSGASDSTESMVQSVYSVVYP